MSADKPDVWNVFSLITSNLVGTPFSSTSNTLLYILTPASDIRAKLIPGCLSFNALLKYDKNSCSAFSTICGELRPYFICPFSSTSNCSMMLLVVLAVFKFLIAYFKKVNKSRLPSSSTSNFFFRSYANPTLPDILSL